MFSKHSIVGRIFVSIVLLCVSVSANSTSDPWLKKIMEELAGERVTIDEVTSIRQHIFSFPVYKVSFSFQYRLPKGNIDIGKGSLYIPRKFKHSRRAKFPLHYQAGYSNKENKNLKLARSGIVVANPEEVAINPLAAGPNRDIAMLHIVRSLPFIDDSRVGIEGGSAGGYIALMLAAESFPISYVHTTGAVLNRGYNLSYLKKSVELTEDPDAAIPVISATSYVVDQASHLFTHDLSSISWYNSSPLSQIDTITSPVSLKVSTADTLVPIDQVSDDFVVPINKTLFPEGFTSDIELVTGTENGKARLLDILQPGQFEVLKVVPPEGLPIFEQMEYDLEKNPPSSFAKMPFSKTKQWSIIIREEGAKIPTIGHIKYLNFYLPKDFNDYYRAQKIKPEQLTRRKLERLMSRFAGEHWLEDQFVTLDYPDAEKQDVLRGLVTFTKTPEAAARFLRLYRKLPAHKQVLGVNIRTAGRESVNQLLERAYNQKRLKSDLRQR